MKRREVRLLWIRHGETEANRLRQYCGHLDEPLNDEGHRQVLSLSHTIKNLSVDHVYSSDLLRCRQTVAGLKGCWPGVAITVVPELRELSFGEWEGFTYDEIHQRSPEQLSRWIDDPTSVSPPGGETLMELDRRLSQWMTTVVEAHRGETIALVSHGGPIRWFLSHCVAGDPRGFWERGLSHGGWLLVSGDGDVWQEIEEIKGERL
ncbi:alpha-ribazole phosphatase [Marininema mesophilum]|uniref:Alpha-ribazole phosphatase n=1 Tax=Marininema mesophilum TaxID=1048340 RepID=A0A1H2YHJ0_9BACL|nr:histidine phosphatase family protein [Marininema mesophilum]SDX04636.1 alpha-ribazole phosphatase [Marininema mesophilum]